MKNSSIDGRSALRNTFVIPKYGKDDVIKDVIEEEFSSADPSIFEKGEFPPYVKVVWMLYAGLFTAWSE